MHVDSMYTISGIARGEKRGRALVKSSCRAEWRRLFAILKGREGALSLEHVRSHARDGGGELIEWDDMDKKQKMNHIADKLAGEGDSANYTHWKFPFGELNHVLFANGVRMEGDPRRSTKKLLGKHWSKKRLSKAKGGEVHAVGRKWEVWDDFYQKVVGNGAHADY